MHLIEQAMGELALEFEPPEIRYSEGGASDRFPEFSQFLDALPRRIAGDKGRVRRADRNSGDPVGVQIRLRQGLINAGLIGAEGAAAL